MWNINRRFYFLYQTFHVNLLLSDTILAWIFRFINEYTRQRYAVFFSHFCVHFRIIFSWDLSWTKPSFDNFNHNLIDDDITIHFSTLPFRNIVWNNKLVACSDKKEISDYKQGKLFLSFSVKLLCFHATISCGICHCKNVLYEHL